MVAGLTSRAYETTICSGERPRARPSFTHPMMCSNCSLVLSMPRLEAESSSSARACALAALYSACHLFGQW